MGASGMAAAWARPLTAAAPISATPEEAMKLRREIIGVVLENYQ
jgi:hypothetical protein